jgi:hypothetical protein
MDVAAAAEFVRLLEVVGAVEIDRRFADED